MPDQPKISNYFLRHINIILLRIWEFAVPRIERSIDLQARTQVYRNRRLILNMAMLAKRRLKI